MVGRANSLGLALFGGDSVEAALERLTSGQADAVVVLENDLYRRTDAARVDAALAAAKVVIVADHQQTATTAKAHLVLPAASFAEGDGTLVSQEGRAQRFFQVFDPTYYDARNMVREGWRWLHAIHSTLQGKRVDWTQLDHVTEAVAEAKPILAGIRDAAPAASFRIKGLKLAREPHRYGGRTAMRANISVHEPRTRRTSTRRSPSPWKATPAARKTVSRSRSPGRRAGTRRRPGTSSRTGSAATCAPATPACA